MEPPRVELTDPAPAELELVRSLQRVLLKYPTASQAAFATLVSEGRRFAQTTEGARWRARLRGSSLLQQVRLVFDLSSLGMLQEGESDDVPSSYLDALFMIASSGDADGRLNQLFWQSQNDETAAGEDSSH